MKNCMQRKYLFLPSNETKRTTNEPNTDKFLRNLCVFKISINSQPLMMVLLVLFSFAEVIDFKLRFWYGSFVNE